MRYGKLAVADKSDTLCDTHLLPRTERCYRVFIHLCVCSTRSVITDRACFLFSGEECYNFRGWYILSQQEIGTISSNGEISLTKQEQKLFEILRKLDYGEVRIIVKEGAPVHVEEIKKSIKL